MGLCYSLRSRLAAAHPSAPYGSRGEPDTPAAAEHGDPQVRHRLRQDLVAKERADKKRSKSIDKTLKAEKREYKQTHRLLLLGERGGAARFGAARFGPARPGRCGARGRRRCPGGRRGRRPRGHRGGAGAHVAAAPGGGSGGSAGLRQRGGSGAGVCRARPGVPGLGRSVPGRARCRVR